MCGSLGAAIAEKRWIRVEIGAIDAIEMEPARGDERVGSGDSLYAGGDFEQLLKQIGPSLSRDDCDDVGSTEAFGGTVGEIAFLPETVEFVASHPIAGSEKRGIEFSRADLFSNQLCILTPTTQTQTANARADREILAIAGHADDA